jgi:hypothetical protein
MTMRTLPRDLYEKLRLPNHGVSQKDITDAFRALRLEIDPLGLDIDYDRLTEIGLAYDVLGDPVSRREYDDYLEGKPSTGAPMSDGTFRRRTPPPAGSTRPEAQPTVVPAFKVTPRIWSPVAYTLWRIDTMDLSTRIASSIFALILVPALIVTVIIGIWQAELASMLVLLGGTYVIVEAWTSMRLGQQIRLLAACAFVITAAVVVIVTWPVTLHILVGILIVCIVICLIAIYFRFFA